MTDQPSAHTFHSASPTGDAAATVQSFALRSAERPLYAFGIRQALPRGPVTTLTERVTSFFDTPLQGPDILVGALPFDRAADDYLFQPHFITTQRHIESAATTAPANPARIAAQPTVDGYAASVSASLALMAADPTLRKVVLSRSLLAEAAEAFDPHALADRLAEDDSVTTFLATLPETTPGQSRMLVGATPELLVSKSGTAIVSHPLAGSARRLPNAADDHAALAELLQSDKDLREHAHVVEAILDTLSPLCTQLQAPKRPSGRATATMWHLGTRIEGVLKSADTNVAELVAALHPTPAVCGLPRDRAQSVIADLETYDRAFYAGTVGHIDRNGDGAWYVSIRCAELAGKTARLYAGAGIVPGSDPAAEGRETSAKFLALLQALGITETGETA